LHSPLHSRTYVSFVKRGSFVGDGVGLGVGGGGADDALVGKLAFAQLQMWSEERPSVLSQPMDMARLQLSLSSRQPPVH